MYLIKKILTKVVFRRRTPESLKVLTGTQDLKGQGVYYFPKKIYVHEK